MGEKVKKRSRQIFSTILVSRPASPGLPRENRKPETTLGKTEASKALGLSSQAAFDALQQIQVAIRSG
jgi:hypothetical protein